MLPELDTRERKAMEREAILVGLNALEASGGIAESLYAVYQSFRTRFLEERHLMDRAPSGEHFAEALTDARVMEAYVSSRWTQAVREAFGGDA